ncbi:hypothetical protein [Propionicicella superfundia]|uniref:hypothetical protein n=1 Tax=Propionicicella superfundia TaxID=348582 RepID=UPI00040D04CD|nr:hypothetical protein [Propionicicella superfundia]
MMWALIFGGIAVAGVIMLVMYGIWLWHKASDLMFELQRLGVQAEELSTLLEQIEFDRLERPEAYHG